MLSSSLTSLVIMFLFCSLLNGTTFEPCPCDSFLLLYLCYYAIYFFLLFTHINDLFFAYDDLNNWLRITEDER